MIDQVEEALKPHSSEGPFFLGELSYVDLMFLPSLERFAANMPRARGFVIKDPAAHPALSKWFEALDSRPSYQKVHHS